VLEEYERRLARTPGERVDSREAARSSDHHSGLKELVRFAAKATALKAEATARDRRRGEPDQEDRTAELFRVLGVLSHKINNPLTSLMGRAQILQMQKGQDPQVNKAAEVIEHSSRRIAGYIRQLGWVIERGRTVDLEQLLRVVEPEEPESRRH